MSQQTIQGIEELVDGGGVVDNGAVFARLWATVQELRARVDACVAVRPDPPEQPFASYATADGACRGSLRTASGERVAWLVQAWLGAPERGFSNMHLNVWLGPQVDVPHLAVVFGTVPELFFYLDHVPRVDLAERTDYLDRYYHAGNHRALELHGDPRLSPFVSKEPYMRAVRSPNAACFLGPLDADVLALAEAAARAHVEQWLAWLAAAEPVPEDRHAGLAARDLRLRRTVAERDPANALAERMFGKAETDRLVAALWGGAA